MRLLNTKTGQFVNKNPEKTRYAILSHTWRKKGEQTYEQLRSIQQHYAPVTQTPQDGRPRGPQGGPLAGSPHLLRSTTSRALRRVGLLTSPRAVLCLPGNGILMDHPRHCPRPFPNIPYLTVHQPYPAPPPSQSIWDDPELSPKIEEACRVARENGYRYIWIDSCCIDKSSSSELSEAINSMYKWYGLARVCYAYLADVPQAPEADHQAEGSRFHKSRWFTRGWTLQELIAPFNVEFLSKDWAPIGSKHALVELVESVTKINYKALLHVEPLNAFCVAQRLSWAANRETTREEDRAYSLLGIFDINMPTLYGEGNRAFRRLQEQIMQQIPDQSLFAWGDVYLRSQLIKAEPCWEARPITDHDWEHLFPMTPSPFEVSGSIRTHPHHHAIQLTPSHPREMIEYTSTPYGTRTRFWMIPLTLDLLLRATQHSEDAQLELRFSEDAPKSAQWYLAILGCEHSEYTGHLLGRVCYIARSESGVDFLHPGYIEGLDLQHRDYYTYVPDLFPLSPETIQHYHLQTELKTVYISHRDHTALPIHSSLRYQPYTAIKLVLWRKTCDTLRSRGYSVDLRDPDLAHPTTHSLTLANDEHSITVEFRHTLKDDGKRFTIDAEVKMSLGSRAQVDSDAPDSDQANRRTVSWWDIRPWLPKPDHKSVRLSAAGTGMLTVDLGLYFAGGGNYFLRVDVLSDAPPASSAVEPAVDQGGAREEERTEECSRSGAGDAEEAGLEEAGGCEMMSAEARDTAATSGNTEGGDSCGALG
ncbi:hypothetical protein V8D89_000311 [Ganoderma adspersum]